MSERFETWPHDAEGIVREALREYVGDGDGEDEKVLTAYLEQERAAARREGQSEAWDEGYDAGELCGLTAEQPDHACPINPYRTGADQ